MLCNRTLRLPAPYAVPLLFLLANTWLAPPAAQADVGLPIETRLVSPQPNELPLPGEILRVTLELTSDIEVGVQGLHVASGRNEQGVQHWQPLLVDAPMEFVLEPGVTSGFAVELVANEPGEPFDIQFQAGTRTVKERFYALPLSNLAAQSLPASIPWIGEPIGAESPSNGADPAIDLWTTPPAFEPEAAATVDGGGDPKTDANGAAQANSPLIRIKGQLVYQRGSDNETIGVDGATVLVYDSNVGNKILLGSSVTLANGTFDFQVFRGFDPAPSIFLVFCAANGMINVQFPWFLGDVKSLDFAIRTETTVYGDFTGDTLDVGIQSAAGGLLGANAPFHILSTLTKAWRYVGGLGFNAHLDRVRVTWPAADTAFYQPSSETIYIGINRQWREDTIIHEFGHHWLHHYGNSPSPEYCNPGGFGDPLFEDCGHKQWCNENSTVAWTEGLPNFLADMTTTWIEDHYHPVVNKGNLELLQMCDENGQFGNPYLTESILGGLLRDIADFANENDPAFGVNSFDNLSHGVASVLSVASSALAPSNVAGFLTAYQLLNPGLGNAFWSTAMNNGYDLDTSPPGTPTNLTSSSHSTTGDSPDGTVDLSWDAPSDDMSGVRRYEIEVTASPAYPGGAGSFMTTYTSATTPELGPGTYYINVVAQDWSGKQSVNYATYGPVTVRAPEPPDFAMDAGRSWPYAVVPRKTEDTSATYAPLPNFLPGDQPQTYFNYRVVNVGELPNQVTVMNRLWVDGVLRNATSVPELVPLYGGQSRIFYNQGPYTVRGGRHMLTVRTDADEVMPEIDEVNNRVARQFVWAPTILVNDPIDRAAPPDPFGGFQTTNPFASVNCDGLAYTALESSAPFTALAIVPDSPLEDPDLRSFPHTTGPENGFSLFDLLADSSRPAGAVDLVATNTALAPALLVDVGIRAFDGMSGGYRAFPLTSTSIPTGTETEVTLGVGEYVSLHHFSISDNFGAQFGTIRVEIEPLDGPLWVALIDPDVSHFGLDDAAVVGRTMRAGVVTLDFTYDAPLHGLVLYRDRPSNGSEVHSLTATVWVGQTPANFTAAEGLAGWVAPVAPTHNAPGTASSVPMPTTLVGGTATTYVNTAIANDGPNPGVPLEHFTRIDAGPGPGAQTSGIVAGGVQTRNFPSALTVPGGRHTLWMIMDPNDLVAESDETDNLWGRQWVWEPSLLASGPAVDFSAPGDPIGGLDAVLIAGTGIFHLNSFGLRDSAPAPSGEDGHWKAVAVMPGASSDVDVRLHDVESGVTNGFATVRASSNWPVGESDYVLTNFRALSAQPMDVGVVAVSGGETFMAQTVASIFLDAAPQGVYGDFVLGDRELMALHEVRLQAGPLAIDLIPIDGTADLGMTLHRANLAYQAKSMTSTNPSVWTAPSDQVETLVANVPEDGDYCLAVWKVRRADAAIEARYRLEFQSTSATDAPPAGAIARTGLLPLQPNPFNPRTVVAFDLEHEARVDLRVLDVRGAFVRRLVAEHLPGGRHETVWDGLDERGHRVASGVYFVALRTGGVRDVRKAVLLK